MKRIVIKDQQGNVDLEGVGFIDENRLGGGWGDGFRASRRHHQRHHRRRRTRFDANEVGHSSTASLLPGATTGIVGRVGRHHLSRYGGEDAGFAAARCRSPRSASRLLPVYGQARYCSVGPANAKQLTISIFDTRQKLVKTITEASPRGRADLRLISRPLTARTPASVSSSTARHIDGAATSGVVERRRGPHGGSGVRSRR